MPGWNRRGFTRASCPRREGIAACEAANVPHRNIIAMQGPFSLALNKALITQFQIRYLVTMDGGAAGGFAEKVRPLPIPAHSWWCCAARRKLARRKHKF